jgi:hypothetical protein
MSIANVAREVIDDVCKSLILRAPGGSSEATAGIQDACFNRRPLHPVNPAPSQAFIQRMGRIVDA